MKKLLIVDYEFHPVGQGLFASGHLTIPHSKVRQPDFSWVYDCGTTSSQDFVNAGLTRLEGAVGGPRPVIDLVVISHFDMDHISGIVKLLAKFSVRTLVIPLIPLWQRLGVLFGATRYVQKNVLPFYLDPVGAISRVDGARIERIVLVPPSEGEGPPEHRSSDNDPPFNPDLDRERDDKNGNDGERIELELPAGAVEITSVAESTGTYGATKVYQIQPGESLSCVGLFEFIPYNDAHMFLPPSAAFVAAASAKAKVLLGATSDATRTDALKALKRQYEARYKGSQDRNAISLYMYAGPVGARKIAGGMWPPYGRRFRYRDRAPWHWCRCTACLERLMHSTRLYRNDGANILYTGDGFLNTPDSWGRLASYLGSSRTRPLLAFQVMHHGSSKNWYENLAQDVRARVAVFSSDPDHKKFKHPHDIVVDDFGSVSRVIKVDKRAGFAVVRVVV